MQPAEPSLLVSILPLVLVVAIFYLATHLSARRLKRVYRLLGIPSAGLGLWVPWRRDHLQERVLLVLAERLMKLEDAIAPRPRPLPEE